MKPPTTEPPLQPDSDRGWHCAFVPYAHVASRSAEDLEAIVLRCLAKDIAGRPASASELRRALLACAVPPWTEGEARAWWADHRGEDGPAPPEALDATLPVDRAS